MVEVFREVRRVTRDDGVLWLNLGDSYAGSGCGSNDYRENGVSISKNDQKYQGQKPGGVPGLKPKDLCMIPFRVAMALQADGWYLRSVLPWVKRNCMPESCSDRPTSAIEYVFLMTKSARYFYDGDAIRCPSSDSYLNDSRPQGILRQKVNKRSKYPDEGQFKKQDLTGNPTYTGFNERYNAKMARNGTNIKGHSGNFNANGEPEAGDGITRNYRNSDPFFESWQGLYQEQGEPLAFVINPQARPELHFACVDDQTEALTTDGWRNIHSLKDHDLIVAFDGVKLSWQEATFHRYPFSGKMVTTNTRDLSMWLTPNHRVVCRDYQNKGDWKIKRADVLKGYEEIPTAAPFDCQTNGKMINPDLAELCGWILTDGGYNHKKCKCITLYQTEGRGKTEQIERIFKSLDIIPKIYRRKKIDRWDQISYSFGGKVAEFIRSVFPSKEGNFGILTTWDECDLRALWKGMTEGDGNKRKDGRITFVGNRSKVNFYQALCIRLGMTCRISPREGNSFAAFVSKKKSTTLRGTNGSHNTVKQDCYYDGIVWCPSVRSGMWLARRNGKPFITGNTFPDLLAATCIKAGTSERGSCPKCGAPWERVVERIVGVSKECPKTQLSHGARGGAGIPTGTVGKSGGGRIDGCISTIGWQPTCTCNEPDRVPCVVFDPFLGSGTVSVVARDLNRSSIGIELNPDYIKIIRRRLQADSQLDTGAVRYQFEKAV
jgi:hypothetical protein